MLFSARTQASGPVPTAPFMAGGPRGWPPRVKAHVSRWRRVTDSRAACEQGCGLSSPRDVFLGPLHANLTHGPAAG